MLSVETGRVSLQFTLPYEYSTSCPLEFTATATTAGRSESCIALSITSLTALLVFSVMGDSDATFIVTAINKNFRDFIFSGGTIVH